MTLTDIWARVLAGHPVLTYRPDFRFDAGFYVQDTPAASASGQDPLQHFLETGIAEGRPGTTYWQVREQAPSLDETISSFVTDPQIKAAIRSGEAGASELAFELMLLGHPVDQAVSDFSADYYRLVHPEVAAAGVNPFLHYLRYGQSEGRQTLLDVRRNETAGQRAFDPAKPTCLICVHEFSRTGAPLVGLQLVQEAAQSHNVVVISLKQGELLEAFVADAVLVLRTGNPDADFGFFQSAILHDIGFAILNSVECLPFVSALVERGIPFANYLHEYTNYTFPSHKPLFTALFSDLLVFSADHVRRSWLPMLQDIAFRAERDSIILPQADLAAGTVSEADRHAGRAALTRLTGRDCSTARIVFGAGYAHWRKGTDLFVLTAQMTRARDPDTVFVWVGNGLNHEDYAFGVWMDQHLTQAGANAPGGTLFFLPAGPHYDDLLKAADVMFLSSRLDPLPNVVFDAVAAGNHVVLFQDTSGFGDARYAGHPNLSLVPFGDLNAACEAVLSVPRKVAPVAASVPPPPSTGLFDRIAAALTTRLRARRSFVVGRGAYDVPILRGTEPHKHRLRQAEREKVWSYDRRFVWKSRGDAEQALRQSGHPVHGLTRLQPYTARAGAATGGASLHVHAFYADEFEAELLAHRALQHAGRLVVTTDTPKKADTLRSVLQAHSVAGTVLLLPNTGRDVLPFLRLFEPGGMAADDAPDTVWGHLHLKRSPNLSGGGDVWRDFLMTVLLGDANTVSVAQSLFEDPKVGLVGAFDPYAFGWMGSSRLIPSVAGQFPAGLPVRPLIFPAGNMFFTRAGVVRRMAALFGEGYLWPNEPLPHDGTVFHLIERLWPSVTALLGLECHFLDKPDQPRR